MYDLTLAITHHKEPEEIVANLFKSIDAQTGYDKDKIQIIVSNDLDEPMVLNYDRYSIGNKVKTIIPKIKNNIGMSRQYIIDTIYSNENMNSKYIMFIDCDDMLCSNLALSTILNSIETDDNRTDVFHYFFYEEVEVDGQFLYSLKKENPTWVFGKVYRVDFLINNNIRFTPTLKYHEDTYFNNLLLYYEPSQKTIDTVCYIWKYNKNSITRIDDGAYTNNSMVEFIDAVSKSVKEAEDRGIAKKDANIVSATRHLLFSLLGDMYYRCQRMNKENKNILEIRLNKFIVDFNLLSITKEDRASINDGIKSRSENDIYFLPSETFYDFLNRIYNIAH